MSSSGVGGWRGVAAALLLAASAGSASQAATPPRAGPSDLLLRWRYASAAERGSFRLYRGQDALHLAPIAELPVGAGGEERWIDPGQRGANLLYRLVYVDPTGAETELATLAWRPPEVSGKPVTMAPGGAPRAGALAPTSHLPSLAFAGEPPAATAALADGDRRAPPTPPPES